MYGMRHDFGLATVVRAIPRITSSDAYNVSQLLLDSRLLRRILHDFGLATVVRAVPRIT